MTVTLILGTLVVSRSLYQGCEAESTKIRTPGLTVEARRAIKLVECARLSEHCSVIQEALVNHQGPWDWGTLIKFTEHYGMGPKQIKACVDGIDIYAQITKDQQHDEGHVHIS